MTRGQAFELLELFKTKAKDSSHLYDAYHGKQEPIHLWFIYENDDPYAKTIATFVVEDIFKTEEYMVEVNVRDRIYQFIQYQACIDLLNTIDYGEINCQICSRIIEEEAHYCEVSDCPHK